MPTIDHEARAAALLARVRRELGPVDREDVVIAGDESSGVLVVSRLQARGILQEVGRLDVMQVVEDPDNRSEWHVPCVLLVGKDIAVTWLPIKLMSSGGDA